MTYYDYVEKYTEYLEALSNKETDEDIKEYISSYIEYINDNFLNICNLSQLTEHKDLDELAEEFSTDVYNKYRDLETDISDIILKAGKDAKIGYIADLTYIYLQLLNFDEDIFEEEYEELLGKKINK